MERMITGFIILAIGIPHFLWPKASFDFRAKLYKKIYGAKVTGTKKTYKVYRIYGALFILLGTFLLLAS